MRAKAIHHSVTIALLPAQGTEAQSATPVCIQLCKCVLMCHKLHPGSVLSVLRCWWVQTLVRLARRCLSYAFIYKMTCHYGAGENECRTAVWSTANVRKRTMAYVSGKLFSSSPLLNSGSSVNTHQGKVCPTELLYLTSYPFFVWSPDGDGKDLHNKWIKSYGDHHVPYFRHNESYIIWLIFLVVLQR